MKRTVYECDKCGKEVTKTAHNDACAPEGWRYVFFAASSDATVIAGDSQLLWCASCVKVEKEPSPTIGTAMKVRS
jgi:hypothetical protein